MGYIYTITDKINAFTFSNATKPYICEYPIILDSEFEYFRRAVRIAPDRTSYDDLDIQRNMISDHEYYELHIKTNLQSDIINILKDLLSGCREFIHDSDYSTLYINDTPFDIDKINNVSKFKLSAKLVG